MLAASGAGEMSGYSIVTVLPFGQQAFTMRSALLTVSLYHGREPQPEIERPSMQESPFPSTSPQDTTPQQNRVARIAQSLMGIAPGETVQFENENADEVSNFIQLRAMENGTGYYLAYPMDGSIPDVGVDLLLPYGINMQSQDGPQTELGDPLMLDPERAAALIDTLLGIMAGNANYVLTVSMV